MKHPALHTITMACFGTSMFSVATALIAALLLIWTNVDEQIATKAFLTSVAFLGAAAATLVISHVTLGNLRIPFAGQYPAKMTPIATPNRPDSPSVPSSTP